MRRVGRRVIATSSLLCAERSRAASRVTYITNKWCVNCSPAKAMPIREFRDSQGVNWRVWPTLPQQKSAHPRTLHDGWLTFECAESKKRIAPIPDGWEYIPITDLERMCDGAEELKPRRSNPNAP
jgi:hypothetical protein